MALTPRRIRSLPPALAPMPSDVFPVSQMNEGGGGFTTRGITREMFQADLIDAVNDARADLVAEFEARDVQLASAITDLQSHQTWIDTAIDQIETIDTSLQAAIDALENKVEHPAQWDEIAFKPDTFPPTLPIDWDDVSNKPSSFPSTTAWADVTGKPTEFPPSSHMHAISDVTGLQTALDNAAASPAQPTWSTLTGRPSTFPPSAHTHPQSDITNLTTDLAAKAPLSHVSDTANPHAVTKAQVGLGNADNTSDVNKPVSTAQQTALNGKANTSHTHAISDVTGLQTALDAKLSAPIAIGTPTSVTPAFGTAYQATTPAKPSFISAMIDTAYSITVAGTQADTVELRIGNNQTTVANGTGGTAVATFRASLTGIALTIGLGLGQRNQLSALLPANWWYAIRRVAGSTATITSATDQSVG